MPAERGCEWVVLLSARLWRKSCELVLKYDEVLVSSELLAKSSN